MLIQHSKKLLMRKGSKHLTEILDKVGYTTCFTDIFPCKILGNKYVSIDKAWVEVHTYT